MPDVRRNRSAPRAEQPRPGARRGLVLDRGRELSGRAVECADEESVMDGERIESMRQLFEDGLTLAQVGEAFGVTRQRVSYLFKRHGLSIDAGGCSAALAEKYGFDSVHELKLAKKKYPGCCGKFRQQVANARRRHIEFKFTLKEWLSIWGDRWGQRGVGGDALVMCRFGDVGPYSSDNVYIATCGANSYDYQIEKRRRKSVDN